jgi:hypothetical protein
VFDETKFTILLVPEFPDRPYHAIRGVLHRGLQAGDADLLHAAVRQAEVTDFVMGIDGPAPTRASGLALGTARDDLHRGEAAASGSAHSTLDADIEVTEEHHLRIRFAGVNADEEAHAARVEIADRVGALGAVTEVRCDRRMERVRRADTHFGRA